MGAYIISRVIGKVLGSYLGACACKADDKVKKYLGLALLPQDSVSIGLAIAAGAIFAGPIGEKIQAIVLAAVVVFDLIGPILVAYTLRKSNEVREERFIKKDVC